MLNRKEYLLTKLIEECVEVAKEASKALTFGLDDKHKDHKSNIEKINDEWNDLMAIRRMLMGEGVRIFDNIGLQDKKMCKVEKYMKWSQERGCLEK